MKPRKTFRMVVVVLVLLMAGLIPVEMASAGHMFDAQGIAATSSADDVSDGTVTYPFSDDMESGVGDWVADSPWGLTEEQSHSATHSWTDSPGANYENNVETSLTLSIDLSAADMPVLSFWQRHALEANKDWGYVDISTNLGSTWTPIYFVTGQDFTWKEEKVDLSQYAGDTLYLRFRLKTDSANRYDGWYIDDVSIAETTATISYPFYDDMESGEANWLSSSWETVTPGHGGTYCFTDSPEGNPPPSSVYTSLTLASTIDLSTAENPQMTFWEHYSAYSSRCYVEVSTNQGRSWTEMARYGGNQVNWAQRQLALQDYAGLSEVRVRFRLHTNSSYDGWYIDDVRIDDSPMPHPLLYTPTGVTMHGAHISWEQYDTDVHGAELDFGAFDRYEIYRAEDPNVDLSDTPVFSTDVITTTSFDDEYCILQPDYYYYRMYVVDENGMFSIGSNAEKATYVVPLAGYPFSDDMESGTANWEWCSPWGLDIPAYSGSYSWQDSPGGTSYANNVENALTTSIDLSTADMPVLSFWQRHALETNKDWGYIDVSADLGSTWTSIYFVTGLDLTWKEEKIDLSQYAGGTLYLRFRLKTDGTNRYDGWYIDDVSIAETTATISYPFYDDMESGEANWLSSSWEPVAPGHGGTHCFTDSIEGNDPSNVYTSLTLASTIDLSTAQNPQMTFWEHYSAYSNRCYVEVSTDMGRTWTYPARYGGTENNWVQRQVSLQDYAGLSEVRVRFRLYTSSGYDGWYIDDVRIDDSPMPHPQLYAPTGVTMHGAHISWEQYDPVIHGAELDFGAFGRYEIYRAEDPNVDLSDTPVFSTDVITTTSFDDEYCILQPDYYYYRMYVVDENGMFSIGSNVEKATYVVPLAGYPFSDDMESGTANWEWCSPWGLDIPAYSGSYSWQDSPGGTSYANNVENALTTSIDLSTADMPVLSFWQRHALETNKDWGYIDVSADLGSTWTSIYFVTGQDLTWKEEKVDLTEYAGGTLFLRFRLKTDSASRYDGWYIDDVSIAETTATISYPFYDDMEGGEANWLSSSWEIVTPGHGGTHCFTDSIEGNGANYVYTSLTLASTIDLSTAQNPQMTFWEHYSVYSNRCYVEVSTDMGRTWTELVRYGGTENNWVQRQVSLQDYAGLSEVRVRFRLSTNSSYDGWYIDDVRIDQCGDVNADGKVNMADVMILWYDIADYPSAGAWTISNEWAADVNCDGKINMADVMILWYDIADYPSAGAWEVNCCE